MQVRIRSWFHVDLSQKPDPFPMAATRHPFGDDHSSLGCQFPASVEAEGEGSGLAVPENPAAASRSGAPANVKTSDAASKFDGKSVN